MKLRYLLPLMIVLSACTIKWGDKELGLMQMQVMPDAASIYDTTVWGPRIKVPLVGTESVFELSGVYLNEKKSIIPVKEDGELPSVCIDLTEDQGNFSNTYATGTAAGTIYPKGD